MFENHTFAIEGEMEEERRKGRTAIAEKRGFEEDEQCEDTEGMNVTVG